MNMLRDEENANYRSVIKNTLEFDPEVLKRYVNFMNNPTSARRSTVRQGRQVFRVCTMLATLPGCRCSDMARLRVSASGYGMEYRRAYHRNARRMADRAPRARNLSSAARRALFAEVKEFLLYDFYTTTASERRCLCLFQPARRPAALVVYNNRYVDTRGWIRVSCASAERTRTAASTCASEPWAKASA